VGLSYKQSAFAGNHMHLPAQLENGIILGKHSKLVATI